jgi:hypothetical protein
MAALIPESFNNGGSEVMRVTRLLVMLALTLTFGCKKENTEAKPDHTANGHGLHEGHRKRIDPGPRLLSAAERIAESTRLAAQLGPEPDYGEERPGEHDTFVVEYRGGKYFSTVSGFSKRPRHDVISNMELELTRPDIVAKLSESMDHDEHGHCAQALVERDPTANVRRVSWSLGLHVTAANGTLTIDDVEALGSGWPAQVDQEARDCYVSMFRGHTIGWDKEENFWFQFPLCIQPTMSVEQAMANRESAARRRAAQEAEVMQ